MDHLDAIYNPGIKQVMEIQYEERKNQDESGDPPSLPLPDEAPQDLTPP